MHILHLIKTSEGATWAINLIKEIKLKYPNITFSVIIPGGGKHLNDYYEVCRSVYIFDYKFNHEIYKQGSEFRKLVLKDNPNIIHSWFSQTTLYARVFLRKFNIPRIFQVVGPAHLEYLIFKIGDIKSAQKNDYWIATSKYILDKYFKAGVSRNKLFLNYVYLNLDELLESSNKIKSIDYRKEFNISKETKIIGTASYMYPPKFYETKGIKGHEFLFNAFELLLTKRSDVVLIIAGSVFGSNISYEQKLKKIAKKISPDKIFFTGEYNNIHEVIKNFDLFVYLSRSENLGGVYESLLFKIPTISSNKGALPELVINDITGYNIKPSNKILLVCKIEELLNNSSNDMKDKGKELVLNTFNRKDIVSNTYNIYKKIIEINKI